MVNQEYYDRYLAYRRRNIVIIIFMSIILILVGIVFVRYFVDGLSFFIGSGLIIAVIMMIIWSFMLIGRGLFTTGEMKYLILSCESKDELRVVDPLCRDYVGSCILQFEKRREYYRKLIEDKENELQ